MLRSLLWRSLALISSLLVLAVVSGMLRGDLGRELRGRHRHADVTRASRGRGLGSVVGQQIEAVGGDLWSLAPWLLGGVLPSIGLALLPRLLARRRRTYARMRVVAYRGDMAEPPSLARAFTAAQAALSVRWWARLAIGQPSLALEIHHGPSGMASTPEAWLAVCCPRDAVGAVESSLRVAYPNLRLLPSDYRPDDAAAALVRLRKRGAFTRRIWTSQWRERDAEPFLDSLITTMSACPGPKLVQIALTPAPAFWERLAKHMYKSREAHLSRQRREHAITHDRSMVEDIELRGGLDLQHAGLFFADIRVLARSPGDCERIASALRTRRAENRLVERRIAARRGWFDRYRGRIARGEGNPLPSPLRGVFAPREVCELWQLPSIDYSAVPFSRGSVPIAPAPPGVERPGKNRGVLRDAYGPVSIHVEMRRQNTAVPGTVEQGKSSFLVATVAEDLRRERCAVIVLDPKGDAADAAISAVPEDRVCTLLDFSDPTCGFNPLAVDAPADVIADYVVAALKGMFSDADIRASSDRYLRNAIIAVLAVDPRATLWDAARLLSVGEEGYAYRKAIGARVRALPELKEISSFFTAELAAQLTDARGPTTSKLDAPANKLARLLNSPSIKRVLLNESLRVDFDKVIAHGEVLIVKGALGAMGAGNTSVLMQLLVGMLDAALARQQDRVPAVQRTSVALKIDEAPLVLNRGFAETMALKRSAGLETVACWQADAQWVDREVRGQLDALFAHRVYFATASVEDARSATALTMAEFSDSVRPGIGRLSALGRPDSRLRLPPHHAIASWTGPGGRMPAFVAETIPMRVDRERLALHASNQSRRGARRMTDLLQPHWEREPGPVSTSAHERRKARGEARDASAVHAPRVERASAPPPRAEEPMDRGRARRPPPAPPPLPPRAARSYGELVDLDRARSVRRLPANGVRPEADLDATDLAILTLIASLGHVLSSQIHRRLKLGRAASTTQRHLKRLADAGHITRLQFHRPDGGGGPTCCSVTPAGQAALEASAEAAGDSIAIPPPVLTPETGEDLKRIRRAVHSAGWGLALAETAGNSDLRGVHLSSLSPPRPDRQGPRQDAPAALTLPGGRVAHEFLRTGPSGERREVERFQTIRPDATILLGQARLTDVLIEIDDRASNLIWVNKLERYDHFLSGWSELTSRYRQGGIAGLAVVFVCRDRQRARDCASRADQVLCACRAYPGDYPQSWQYPGRRRIVFVAERDIHEGHLCAWGVPPLPPALRQTDDDRDSSTGRALLGSIPIAAT